jgi:excisionase family DNA binding protein
MTKTAPLIERPPSRAESAQARRSLDALRNRAAVAVGDATPPASAVAALERVLEALADGGGVAILPLDAELTTQEAADVLGVSRPTLVKLLDAGAIPFRTLGAHRRLKVADLLAYREARDAERRAALDRLVAENQRLGVYDD